MSTTRHAVYGRVVARERIDFQHTYSLVEVRISADGWVLKNMKALTRSFFLFFNIELPNWHDMQKWARSSPSRVVAQWWWRVEIRKSFRLHSLSMVQRCRINCPRFDGFYANDVNSTHFFSTYRQCQVPVCIPARNKHKWWAVTTCTARSQLADTEIRTFWTWKSSTPLWLHNLKEFKSFVFSILHYHSKFYFSFINFPSCIFFNSYMLHNIWLNYDFNHFHFAYSVYPSLIEWQ